MVKKYFEFLAWVTLLGSLSGCSVFNRLWHSEPPPRKMISLKGDSLPSFVTVFGDDDKAATDTLEKWRKSIDDSLKQIKGSKKNFLTPRELDILVKRGFIKMADDQKLSLDRAHSVLRLTGFKNGIPYDGIHSLFDWIRDHRVDMRKFYKRFVVNNINPQDHWNSKDLALLMQLFGSFLERAGDDQVSDTEMVAMIQPWMPEGYPHAKAAMKSGVDLTIAFFASFCGDRVDQTYWNGKRVGTCLRQVVDEFRPTEPLFDYFFGELNPSFDRQNLAYAAAILKPKVENWLSGHHHPNFQTGLVAQFARDLSLPPPYYFFKLTEWMPQLNSQSTERELSPTFFVDVAGIFQNWIAHFMAVTERSPCHQVDWKSCVFTGKFDPVDRLYNPQYATLIRSKNFGFVNKIALYDSISSFIMQALDTDHDGYLSRNTENLVTVAIRLLDTNAFASNVIQRLFEKPVDLSSTEDSTKAINREGLTQLAALAADLIPQGDDDDRTFLKKFEQSFKNKNKDLSYEVNQLGITTFLYVYDLISGLRDEYLSHYDLPITPSGSMLLVKRRKIMESMPRMLHDHFPRIYNECLMWGFERTCGVIFTEVLSGPNPGQDTLETYEMDVITMVSVLVESMMDHCDRNGDGVLTTNIFDGMDEKHCMINLANVTVNRLMKSKILKENAKTKKLLNLANDVWVVKWAAKKALSRGSIKRIWSHLIPPFSFLSGPATMGSILHLAAEFMASDKVKAVDQNSPGPKGDPGDEIIYFHELSEKYLPSQEPIEINLPDDESSDE